MEIIAARFHCTYLCVCVCVCTSFCVVFIFHTKVTRRPVIDFYFRRYEFVKYSCVNDSRVIVIHHVIIRRLRVVFTDNGRGANGGWCWLVFIASKCKRLIGEKISTLYVFRWAFNYFAEKFALFCFLFWRCLVVVRSVWCVLRPLFCNYFFSRDN